MRRLDDGELDPILITADNEGMEPRRGEVVFSEPLVWACREGGIAAKRSPCRWPWPTTAALGAGRRWLRWIALALPTGVAYTSEHCSGQASAMLADLAIAPFPLSLVPAPLRKVGARIGPPPVGEYQVLLMRRPGIGRAGDALAGCVVQAFG